MNNFLQKIRNAMYKFSYGRYGMDEFSKFLLYSGFGCLIIFWITKIQIIYTLAVVLLVYNIYRTYSKNFTKRYKERDTYLFYKRKFDSKIALQKRKWSERKTHKFFKCPTCKTVVRVPKGRGKIEITCPKCQNHFVKKS